MTANSNKFFETNFELKKPLYSFGKEELKALLEKRKQSLSGTNQPSIPVITVTCDDSEAEEEEEDVSEYGFVRLEECNTNSIQEDSLEINVTDYDVSVLEVIEYIPCVNIIPPSLPQSPHFEAYPEENFVINDDEVIATIVDPEDIQHI